MSQPLDVRREQIKADDGDPENTVYACRSGCWTYHSTLDCHNASDPETYEEMTRENAQDQTCSPCGQCVKAVETDQGGNQSGTHLATRLRSAAVEAEASGDDTEEAVLRAVREQRIGG